MAEENEEQKDFSKLLRAKIDFHLVEISKNFKFGDCRITLIVREKSGDKVVCLCSQEDSFDDFGVLFNSVKRKVQEMKQENENNNGVSDGRE